MSLTNEEKLIQDKLNAGEAAALEILFHKYFNDLCRYLIVILKDQNVAKNIVQDLFLYIWEKHETISFSHSIESYLYQASRLNALVYLRNESRKANKKEELLKRSEKQDDSVNVKVELDELQRIIDEAIELLPERCREIFILSRRSGLSYLEIAEQLGISSSTVDNQVNIALKKIKGYMHKNYPNFYVLAFVFNHLTF